MLWHKHAWFVTCKTFPHAVTDVEFSETKILVCYIAATTERAVWYPKQLQELRHRHGYEVFVILNGHVCDLTLLQVPNLFGLPRKIIALVRLLRRERSAELPHGLPMCRSAFR